MENINLNEDVIHPVIERELRRSTRLRKQESGNSTTSTGSLKKTNSLIGKKRRGAISIEQELIKRKMNEQISNDIDKLVSK